ncbi:unnamed protein product [marine sediment metagenome]|uniref:Uncharacterized protein n=1 Tax=marine sediment metagenome TaxID=412755 RepID=X1B2G7_9ZZZZ
MAKIKKDKKINPYLNPDGSFDLIDKFPGIDFDIYEEERIKEEKGRNKMPLMKCKKDDKSGWKYGDSGACYTYKAGDEKSEAAAKLKAIKQVIFIFPEFIHIINPAVEFYIILQSHFLDHVFQVYFISRILEGTCYMQYISFVGVIQSLS